MALGSGNGLRYDPRVMRTKCRKQSCQQGGPGEDERTQRCVDINGLRRVTPHKVRVDDAHATAAVAC